MRLLTTLFAGAAAFSAETPDLFLVNRVACEASACAATCGRYCAKLKQPRDLLACSHHLHLAHCSLDVELTETYKLNTSLPNVCFSPDLWIFELPSWVHFKSVSNVDLIFSTKTAIQPKACGESSSLRALIYDISDWHKAEPASTAPADPTGVSDLRVVSDPSAVSVSTPSAATTCAPLTSSAAPLCTDLAAAALRRAPDFGAFLEKRKVEVLKQQLSVTGSDFRGSIEKGHRTFLVKPSHSCDIDHTEVEVQLSGRRSIPLADTQAAPPALTALSAAAALWLFFLSHP